MYRTIVLALDASEGAGHVIPEAIEIAGGNGSTLILAHARTRALETAFEQELDEQAKRLSEAGNPTRVVVRTSLVGEEADFLAEVVDEEDADLVVIASRGRSPFAGAVLGSVTTRLLHRVSCPVLVVSARAARPASEQQQATVSS